jgi:hypothetical protein|tara:strand:- start:181 stop:357 length:177 start_codon:yes stop_codon:yes gene_type:complete
MEIKQIEVQNYLDRETDMDYEGAINVLTNCLNDSRFLEEFKKEVLEYADQKWKERYPE